MKPVTHILIKYGIVIAAVYISKLHQLTACVIKIVLNSFVFNLVLLKFSILFV